MKDKKMIIKELRRILSATTKTKKHSAYQILPSRLVGQIDTQDIELHPKWESERLEYILSKIDIKNKSFLDIGCNTGYFLIEILDAGAVNVTGYEGGKNHHRFIQGAIELLDIGEKAEVIGDYFDFKRPIKHYDVGMLFNVLHHLGDDYDDKTISMNAAKVKMIQQLNKMSESVDTLLFQMGFNWQGNIEKCLFENGTKSEMIDYIKSGTKDNWEIQSIGIAQRRGEGIVYEDLNSTNVERDDSLGEFLNRPLFVLKSKNNEKK